MMATAIIPRSEKIKSFPLLQVLICVEFTGCEAYIIVKQTGKSCITSKCCSSLFRNCKCKMSPLRELEFWIYDGLYQDDDDIYFWNKMKGTDVIIKIT